MVIKPLVTIQIKVVYKEDEVFRRHLSITVFSLKLAQFFSPDVPRAISVDSPECNVRFEVPDSREDLSHFLNCQLLFRDKE